MGFTGFNPRDNPVNLTNLEIVFYLITTNTSETGEYAAVTFSKNLLKKPCGVSVNISAGRLCFKVSIPQNWGFALAAILL